MTLTVKDKNFHTDPFDIGERVNVVVDGQCNHADTHLEEFMGPDDYNVQVDEVCNGCGAFRNPAESEWFRFDD